MSPLFMYFFLHFFNFKKSHKINESLLSIEIDFFRKKNISGTKKYQVWTGVCVLTMLYSSFPVSTLQSCSGVPVSWTCTYALYVSSWRWRDCSTAGKTSSFSRSQSREVIRQGHRAKNKDRSDIHLLCGPITTKKGIKYCRTIKSYCRPITANH